MKRPVTSVSALVGRRVSHEELIDLLVPRFAEVFEVPFVDEQRAAFARGTAREFDVDRRVAAGDVLRERRPTPGDGPGPAAG